MSTYIPETILSWWRSSGRTKSSPSGWISGNAVCCEHHGTSKDTRGRGGIRYNDGGIQINCFNCGFKTGWSPGKPLGAKLKKFMSWLGIPDDQISKCVMEALKVRDSTVPNKYQLLLPRFNTIQLPDGAKLISEYIDNPPPKLLPVLQYIASRGLYIDDYDWYWSPKMADRLIIPFKYQNRIVGYTGRSIIPTSRIKYLNDQQMGYVFNLDKQTHDKKFVIVCEGPMDAICIDGVSLQGNTLNHMQKLLINQLHKEVIIVPDKDKAGRELVEYARDIGWSVSFPEWDKDIKDINDAIKKYGRLYTLYSIVKAKQHSALKINLLSKTWFNQ
jgi:hypothetical protein